MNKSIEAAAEEWLDGNHSTPLFYAIAERAFIAGAKHMEAKAEGLVEALEAIAVELPCGQTELETEMAKAAQRALAKFRGEGE